MKGHVLSDQPHVPSGPNSTIGPRVCHSNGQGSNTQSVASFFVLRNVSGGKPTLHAIGWNKEMHAEASKAVGIFFYYCNIHFNFADSPFYDVMVNALTTVAARYKPLHIT